jgi:1-deoxy-D-xylulose-5-phosphate synthase
MNIAMKEMPERMFDVGIAEGHAVTFSAGMAKDGLVPFCNIYSSFAQRAYDNIIHDVAILGLPVVLCLDRAGLVGEDGPTHHGAFDMAALRPIPNLTICSPMNEHELRRMMYTAQQPNMGTFVIRYPRGRGSLTEWRCKLESLPVGKGRMLREGTDIALLTIGPIGKSIASIANDAAKEGISIAHYDMRFLKPIDEDILHEVASKFKHIITLEDGTVKGGLGSAVTEFMAQNGYTPRIHIMGIPDEFVEHGTTSELYQLCKMDKAAVWEVIQKIKKESL